MGSGPGWSMGHVRERVMRILWEIPHATWGEDTEPTPADPRVEIPVPLTDEAGGVPGTSRTAQSGFKKRPIHEAFSATDTDAIFERPHDDREFCPHSRPRGAIRIMAACLAVVLMSGGLILASSPTRTEAYLYYPDYPHMDHDHKLELKWYLWRWPELPFYRYAVEDAARRWSFATDVKIVENVAEFTPLHIVTQRYYDSQDSAWGRGRVGDRYNTSSHHIVSTPGGYAWLNGAHLDKYRGDAQNPYVMLLGLHEFGHAMGLDHVWDGCGSGWNYGIMQPNLRTAWEDCGWDSPRSDDINGINNLYSAGK